MYSLICDILEENTYTSLDVVCHFPWNMLIRNPDLLDEIECAYTMNPATHLDFFIFNRMQLNQLKWTIDFASPACAHKSGNSFFSSGRDERGP